MARQGISEQQVIEAAEQLAQSGQAVTVAAVREVIGSGSFSTINGFLAKWKDSGDRKPADIPDMPDNVARAMRQLWAAAWRDAQAAIQAEREALDAGRREMEQARREMGQEIARLEAENGQQAEAMARLNGELAEKAAALDMAEKSAAHLQVENARLDERAKAAETRSAELKEELARLHRQFEALRQPPDKS